MPKQPKQEATVEDLVRWTEIMRDESRDVWERLEASEKLALALGDFSEDEDDKG